VSIHFDGFFDYDFTLMNITIDVLMGWDRKLHCPIPSGGLFDFCKGFFASWSPKDFGTSMPTS